MLETRDKRKLWYDKNAVHRQYKSGDQVLVLAASMPNKLSVQWIGPGEIQSQLSETNYIVKMTGKEAKPQIFHVNLLKPYHKRLAEVNLVFHEEKVNVETENDLEIAYPTGDVNAYDFEEISRSSNLEERLTTEQIGELKELLHKHKTVFSNKPGKTHLVEHDIELISNQPVRSKPYRTSQRQAEILKSEIKQMLDLKIIEMGQSDYTSPMLLVEAPGKAPRPCIDYRKLNSTIAIYSETWEEHLKHVDEVLKRIGAANLTVKPSKCQLAQSRTKYLGHMVGDGVRTPAEAKIKAVIDFPTPKTKTQIRAFLGLAGYYAHYVEKFSVIAAPLTNALKGRMTKEQIRWTPECEQAFQELKMSLTKKPVLHAPDYTKKFIVQTDASDVGMGVMAFNFVSGRFHIRTPILRIICCECGAKSDIEGPPASIKWAREEGGRSIIILMPIYVLHIRPLLRVTKSHTKQNQVLEENSHVGHPGIVKMKALQKATAPLARFDASIANFVQNCSALYRNEEQPQG
ncbi:Retrovirus-related Pol polyprotein like [Argiope bruennichi]|uniref:RNA-directed DNA polymerase n=1 Tax=Argiope bruennichi TaxID=94029 RepID=A0A8T0EDC7_ARGBR|nr:Retrovirus-related Pol polyprotein like [Argiope bruennichi]